MKLKKKLLALFTATTIAISMLLTSANVQAQIYKGVDVYEYDNISNYQQLKDNGTQVIIQKATQGLYHNDSLLQYRYNQIMQYGFKIGYYHFANNSGQPVAEAQHFLNQIKGLHSDTILWLDIENTPNWTKQQAVDYTNQFVNYVRGQGYQIGIYTGLSFFYEYLQGNIDASIPLWLASYGRQPAQFPNVVSWQYTDQGLLPGVIGNIDMNYFNDSIFTGVKPNSNTINNVNSNSNNSNVDQTVLTIQRQLNAKNNAQLSEDGVMGNLTRQAIINFQSKYGLSVDGSWGVQCATKMDELYGNKINVVNQPVVLDTPEKVIQAQLNGVLGTHLTIDGVIGAQTKQQIRIFQTVTGITVDGIWGQECVNVINQIYVKPLCKINNSNNKVATRVIQYRMGIQFDSIYGNDSYNHVTQWQFANRLISDGIFGGQSWNKLLN